MAASLPANVGKVMTLMQCPRDVLERVISFLPVPDIFRLRTVCKEWNEIITTRAFKEKGQLRFNKLQLLAVCNSDSAGSDKPEFKAYDVDAQKWRSFDLSFLPGDGSLRVLDFAGGLACVMHKSHTQRLLYVCNPLTKSLARLPSPLCLQSAYSSESVIVRMYYCRKTGHYKVFVVSGLCVNPDLVGSSVFDRLVVEEFDSCSWTWALHYQICKPFMWWDMMGAGVLPCNNENENGASLFILLYKSFGHNLHRGQLFALRFDEEKGDLGFVKIEAALPDNLLSPRLVFCERSSCPLLVSAVRDVNGGRGVGIWELGNKLSEWRMLAVMPGDFFKYLRSLKEQVRKRLIGGMTVLGLEHLPLYSLRLFPELVVGVAYKHLIYIHPQDVVAWTIVFDTRTHYWHLLPPQITRTRISPVINVSSCVRECAFEPSLENVVSEPTKLGLPGFHNWVLIFIKLFYLL